MKLIITNYKNVFKVKGSLVKMHIQDFKNEFKDVFEKQEAITLNLKGLTAIDNQGVVAITQLHNEALSKNIKLTIIGFDNVQLANHYKTNKVA